VDAQRNKIHLLLAGFPALTGMIFVGLSLLSYEQLKVVISPLLADHNFNSLKPWNAGIFSCIFAAVGVFLLGDAVITGMRRWKLVNYAMRRILADARTLIAELRFKRRDVCFLSVLMVILVLAVIYRLEHIVSPMHHDEAYTYVAFARSFFTAVSDYHLPNNHVFHSILLFFSTRIFGIQPWAVRLPALSAGVLCVPAGYWLAKRYYNEWVALVAAFLIAWFPPFIAYANNARGYTLVALLSILILVLGDIVRKDDNVFVWFLISVCSALGFYTVPVFIFPFGVLFTWLLLENWSGDTASYRTKWQFILYWASSGFGAIFLTVCLYLPILIFSGPAKLLSNPFVKPLPWDTFLITIEQRFIETWGEWTFRVPVFIVILLISGWVMGLAFHKRFSKIRLPLQLAAFLWIVMLLLVQRPNAFSKTWVFLQPLMMIWAAAGVFGMLGILNKKLLTRIPLSGVVAGLILAFGIVQAFRLIPQLPRLWSIRGGEERAVVFVKSQLRNNDLLLVSPTDDAAVWYYSDLHDIPEANFHINQSGITRALVFVNTGEDQIPEKVIADNIPAGYSVDFSPPQLLGTFGWMQVFEVQP
jgi:hypothetical protein